MTNGAFFGVFRQWHKTFRGYGNENSSRVQTHNPLDVLAQTLRDEGVKMWLSDPHKVVEAIEKIEQSWSLRRNPDTAVQLGVMYDLVNRHQDTLVVQREAFHLFPTHARLRHEAGVTLLRHGQPSDIQDFIDSVLQIDPDDIFAKFVSTLLTEYPRWVGSLATKIKDQFDGKTVYTLACPIWGKSFAEDFIRYLCAALMSPNNLPSLARRHPVVFAIFTTAEIEEYLKADPIFKAVANHATFHFTRYDATLVEYNAPMVEHYGTALGPYYARTCKFLLLSCAHYVALAAGRDLDSTVVPLCSDSILSDGVLTGIAEIMAGEIDVVCFWGFRLTGRQARESVEQGFRAPDGSISISPQSLARLFVKYAPDAYDVASANFSSFPENLYWRVGRNALLVHASHYHPICIRPSSLVFPLELTTDPVDSRFLDKHFFQKERLHFVRDLSIGSVNLEDESTVDSQPHETRTMLPRDVGQWLWQVWGPWRAANFESPICISDGPLPPEWEIVRDQARRTTMEIMSIAMSFEEGNRRRKSWKSRNA